MKKILKYTALSLLAFLPAVAQNTATVSGNWDDCATWGSPASIIQNNTDTKTINAGVTVAQNTAWSTQNIVLNGNGAITFASASNSIDFVTDGGGDKTCVVPNCTSPSGTIAGAASITYNTNSAYTLTATNYTSVTWTITPGSYAGSGTTATLPAGAPVASYVVTFNLTNTGACTSVTTAITKNITVAPPAGGCGTVANCTAGGFLNRYGIQASGSPNRGNIVFYLTGTGYTNIRVSLNGGAWASYSLSPTNCYGNGTGTSYLLLLERAGSTSGMPYSIEVTNKCGQVSYINATTNGAIATF